MSLTLRTLTISRAPLSLPHHLLNPNPNSPRRTHTIRPNPIICKATDAQTRQISTSEPDGSGAAAPTRGEIFLDRHHSLEASSFVLAGNKKDKKKTEKEKRIESVKKLSASSIASCYGCGAPLQTSELDAPGYVDPETYALKKKHHQLRRVLCGRCRLLSHGHMITAVGGHGGYAGGKQFVTAEELRDKLSHLRYEKALIVKLVDIVDFNGSFLARVRDLVGANPIILVVTKVDLLPKGTDLNCVGDWVVEATMKKKLNVLSVHLTSSKSLIGVAGVLSEIQKEKKGRDVYILGAANVGKSAFINALLKMMAEKDPVAAAAQKYKPIMSAVPGTTLGPIEIDAFLGGGKLYDTPGVHLHHRQAAVIHSEDLPALAPQSRLRGQSISSSVASSLKRIGEENETRDLNGYSIFWGGLARIDVLKISPLMCLTFYGPKVVPIHTVRTDLADLFYQKELGVLLTPPSRKQKTEDWTGLGTERHLQIEFESWERPTCDVAISGLGWITVEPIRNGHDASDLSPVEVPKELQVVIRVPKPVEIFIRPPMPLGKAGAEWYQYRELTEKEQEIRPRWYF